jgi:hypothetical protein
MAILRNVEIHFAKLGKAKPGKFSNGVPIWELQARTHSRKQKKEWEDLGLKPKQVDVEEEVEVVDSATGETYTDVEIKETYWRLNLSKKAVTADGEEKPAPDVVDGRKRPVDPTTIGNGSIANIRVYLREYNYEGIDKVAPTLMAVQLVKHVVYAAAPREDFDEEFDTDVVGEQSEKDDDGFDEHDTEVEERPAPAKKPTAAMKPAPAMKKKPAKVEEEEWDDDEEIPF